MLGIMKYTNIKQRKQSSLQNSSFHIVNCPDSPLRNKAKNALSLAMPFSLGLAGQRYEENGKCKGKNKKLQQIAAVFCLFFNLVGKTSFPKQFGMGSGTDKPYQFDSFFFVVNHQPIGSDVTFPCAFIFAG